MNRCGNCKFWGLGDEPHTFDDPIYKPCGAIHHDAHEEATGAMDEATNAIDPDGEAYRKAAEVAKRQLAVTVDGSGYYAALKTKEDFGCVLWADQEPIAAEAE